MPSDMLGFMEMHGSAVQNTDKYLHLNSTSSNDFGHGTVVTPDNFERACVTFASRKSILPDASWINDKDTFRKPSDEFQNSAQWNDFVNDSVVYSLFHRSSYQTSLRNFDYMGETYDVHNEWFFMPKAEVVALAEKYELNDIVYDAHSSDERFVYTYLQDKKLSPEANAVLREGKELIRKTFVKRFLANQERPDWHLMTWDAGYCQAYKITTLFKEEYAQRMSEFSEACQILESKIRAQVYKDKILEK
jgi:hypothetical protein